MKEPIGSGVFAHWKNTRCNGCGKIVAHPPPKSQGSNGREAFYCSPGCEEKSKEAPRDQFDQYARASITFRQAGGGRNTGKGRR